MLVSNFRNDPVDQTASNAKKPVFAFRRYENLDSSSFNPSCLELILDIPSAHVSTTASQICLIKDNSANFYFLMKGVSSLRHLNAKNVEVLELNLLIIVNIFKGQINDI